MSSAISLLRRVYRATHPPTVNKLATQDDEEAAPKLRFGILGAAAIAPNALITPALSHPEVEVYAVAARDPVRGAAYAKKWAIAKVHSSYQDLIDDEEVDVVYNPLPNGMHYEWTMRALEKGKHVLLEKPAANTVEETKRMFEFAESKGLVLLEAFHYRFHPAAQRAKEILSSGELGKIKQVSTSLTTPGGYFNDDDIRFKYELGGGAFMDMGCYTLNAARYLTSSEPLEVTSTKHDAHRPSAAPLDYVPNVDRSLTADLALSNDITATLHCNLGSPLRFGFLPQFPDIRAVVVCERGSVELYNFVLPTLYHTLTLTRVDENGRRSVRKEKAYVFADAASRGQKGKDWWTTYRYQLEAFVDRVKGRQPQAWITKEDSISNMEWIEKIYDKAGLGVRPKSSYVSTSH